MKKILILSFLLALSVGLMAQSGTTTVFGSTSTSASYTGIAADTLNGTSAATKYWTFDVRKPNLYYYVVTARFDAVTTTTRAAGSHIILTMAGSVDNTNWVTLDTTLFHPAATGNYRMGTTLVPASDVATGVLWRYLKFTAVASDANKAALLKFISIKIGNRY
jgi:hypothetical protein